MMSPRELRAALALQWKAMDAEQRAPYNAQVVAGPKEEEAPKASRAAAEEAVLPQDEDETEGWQQAVAEREGRAAAEEEEKQKEAADEDEEAWDGHGVGDDLDMHGLQEASLEIVQDGSDDGSADSDEDIEAGADEDSSSRRLSFSAARLSGTKRPRPSDMNEDSLLREAATTLDSVRVSHSRGSAIVSAPSKGARASAQEHDLEAEPDLDGEADDDGIAEVRAASINSRTLLEQLDQVGSSLTNVVKLSHVAKRYRLSVIGKEAASRMVTLGDAAVSDLQERHAMANEAQRKKLPNLKTAYSGLASQLVAIEKRTAGVKRDCEQYEKEAQAAIAGLEQKKRQCIDGLATEARELLGQFEAELDTIALRAEKHNRKLKKKRKATAAQAKLLIQQLEQATRGSPLYDDDEDDDSLV